MPGSTITSDLLYGFAGNVAQNPESLIETSVVDAASADIPFGHAVITGATKGVQKAGATTAMTNFVGVAASQVQPPDSYTNQNAGGSYAANEAVPVCKRGSVSVKCLVGTPARFGKVYLRLTANSAIPTGVVGGFEAAADGSNTVEITNAKWGSGKDANHVATLILNTANL